ncbi:T9SS type A sorting domain-containing protein, partial [Pontibacter sp. E15-1]|uniref:LamG-like jellyroll fold domain-containing protein n=1 Tax=Pontibacter sp. E15-1 TaxID=2919918 RepID=UPI001F5008F6
VSAITGTGKLRLDLRATGTGIADTAANAVAGGFIAGQLYTVGLPPATSGFATITRLDPIPISSSTGEKPQSKVWKYAGKHWAVLPNASGTYLWRLDGTAWTSVLRLSSRTTSKADCKVVGNLAHILLFQGRASQMVSVEYDATAQTFKLWSKRTSTVGLSFESGVEVATIDMDGTGRMWLVSDGNSTVHVRWSDSPYNTWSTPYTVATGISSDDISAIIALPGKIGVLWSNQNTKRFGFKTHTDGDPPTTWSNDEVPASLSALETGHGMADDHMNMAVATNGTLYCAVKTSYDTSEYPELVLLLRRPTGVWENIYEIAPLGTRPVVILNETEQKLRVVYTAADGGGDINYKESALAPVAFGVAKPLLVGGAYNNATSTKENFLSDIVIMASSSTEAVSVLASVQDTPPTPVPTNKPGEPVLVMPANLNVKQPLSLTLGWRMSANTASYQAQVSTLSDFATTVFNRSGITDTIALLDGLAGNKKYFWRVRAMNSTDTSTWSPVWSFTTIPSNSLVGHWKMDEGSGSTLLDASGFENNAVTISGPTWVPGKEGLALWLNGSSQYASVSDHETLDITDSLTLAVWVKPDRKGTQYILKKAENNVADGYELSFSSSGVFFFRINESTSNNTYRLNSKTPYPTNGATWLHIAATFDGTTIKLYANGVLDNSMTLSSSIKIKANDMPLYLGSQGSGSYKFEGGLDDARVYKTALTAAEINELATGSLSAAASSKLTSGRVAAPTIGTTHELTVYPNPFTSKAIVNYMVPEDGYHTIKLYDSKGRLVRILHEGSIRGGQQAAVEVDGSTLAKGLYILRLEAAHGSKTLKLVLEK